MYYLKDQDGEFYREVTRGDVRRTTFDGIDEDEIDNYLDAIEDGHFGTVNILVTHNVYWDADSN